MHLCSNVYLAYLQAFVLPGRVGAAEACNNILIGALLPPHTCTQANMQIRLLRSRDPDQEYVGARHSVGESLSPTCKTGTPTLINKVLGFGAACDGRIACCTGLLCQGEVAKGVYVEVRRARQQQCIRQQRRRLNSRSE
jgi:hypothetical protein